VSTEAKPGVHRGRRRRGCGYGPTGRPPRARAPTRRPAGSRTHCQHPSASTHYNTSVETKSSGGILNSILFLHALCISGCITLQSIWAAGSWDGNNTIKFLDLQRNSSPFPFRGTAHFKRRRKNVVQLANREIAERNLKLFPQKLK